MPRRVFAPESRARLFIVIAILLATTFGVFSWRGIRDERTRVAFRTCFYAEDAARLLQSKTQRHLEQVALTHLTNRGSFRLDLDARGAVSAFTITRGDPEISAVRLAQAIDGLESDVPEGAVVAVDVLDAIAIMRPTYGPQGRTQSWNGIIVSPGTFVKEVVKPVFDSEPLFSTMLSAMIVVPNHSLANFAIKDARSRTLYATGMITDTVSSHLQDPWTTDNYDSPGCVGQSAQDPTMANLSFLVSPTLPVYNRWIENGLVASYVPSLGVILAAMLACMAAAILFARREADLARLRSDFVSHVSHELRMPLAQIVMSSETLRLGRTRSQEERDGEADSIARAAYRLTGFVENILSFSRIEHHNVQVAPQLVRLCPVVNETIATARQLADGRAAAIVSAVPEDLEAFVDPDGFRQVLYNLLENAIKYGPAGQRVLVGAAPWPEAADRIDVWVDDEGPGVPSNATSTIFEPFVRLERDRSAGVGGSGLGLAVVRFIIEQHGGRVRIERGSRGVGARFVLDIPSKR